MNALIVIPFCKKDAALTLSLLEWMGTFVDKGSKSDNPLLLVAENTVDTETLKKIGTSARESHSNVSSLIINSSSTDWRAPNEMFLHTSRFIKGAFKCPFLWMEPDCVPLMPGWFEEIIVNYEAQPKKFMGTLIKCDDPKLPPLHMTGCSVYPVDAIDILENHCNENAKFAWDVDSAKTVVEGQKVCDTDLIHHFYGELDLPPTFVVRKEPGKTYPTNTLELSFIRQSAVLFHRCKDGSLINALREREQSGKTNPKK